MAPGSAWRARSISAPHEADHYLKRELYELMRVDGGLFEFLQSGSLDGVWFWDVSQPENAWFSPRVWEVLGYRPEGMSHHVATAQDLMFPDDREKLLVKLDAHLSTPGSPAFDSIVRYRRADGGTSWIRCRGMAIRDAQGNPVRMLGAHNDVTAFKRAEEEARAMRSRLELAAVGTVDGLWELRLATQESFLSDRSRQLLEYGPGEPSVRYDAWITRLHPEDRERTRSALRRHIEDKARYDVEFRVLMKSGQYRWFRSAGQCEWDAEGKPVRVVGSVSDIHARKQAEAALERERALLASVVGSMAESVVAFDETGAVLLMNDAARELLGSAPSLPPLERWVETFALHAPEGLDGARSSLATAVTGGSVDGLEMIRITSTGERILRLSARPMHAPDGRVFGTVVVLRDETTLRKVLAEQRRKEQALAAANRELEAFSYSVSHDLRAPLRGLDGFSQALLEDCGDQLDAHGRDYLMRIRKNAQRMGSLVDDLLRLSRVMRVDLNVTPVDLSELASQVVDALRASEPGRVVTVDIQPGLTAQGDAGLLRVMLENLLANAFKFTASRAHAHVTVGSVQRGKEQVFFVRDDGVGFDPSYAHKLFAPFQRLHTEAEFKGTGIGLATVQRIATRHGGRAWAEATLGEGATFSVTLAPPPD